MTPGGGTPEPYPLGLLLAGRRVLMVGGGAVATRRVPALLAAQRPDRAGTKLLQVLAAELNGLPRLSTPAELLRPLGRHFVPDAYAPDDLLV